MRSSHDGVARSEANGQPALGSPISLLSRAIIAPLWRFELIEVAENFREHGNGQAEAALLLWLQVASKMLSSTGTPVFENFEGAEDFPGMRNRSGGSGTTAE